MQKLIVLLLGLILVLVFITFIQTNFSLTSNISQSALKNPVPLDNGLSRIEIFINFMILFSTVVLGTFAAIGALLVWNGLSLREEARKDIEEIKEFGRQAARLYSRQMLAFNAFKKVADSTFKKADQNAKILEDIVAKADKDSKDIKAARDSLSSYNQSRTNYSTASLGTAQYFSSQQAGSALVDFLGNKPESSNIRNINSSSLFGDLLKGTDERSKEK